jgi:hypothetical protein
VTRRQRRGTLVVAALLTWAFGVQANVVYASSSQDTGGPSLIFSQQRKIADAKEFPRDEVLMNSFRSHRTAFERLREMVIEDEGTQPIFTENNISGSLPLARQQEYKSLLSSITSDLMVTVNYDGTVRFIFVVHGASIGTESMKGIEYLPESARPGASFVHDLNNPKRYADGVYLRAIEPRWFVLFQKTD